MTLPTNIWITAGDGSRGGCISFPRQWSGNWDIIQTNSLLTQVSFGVFVEEVRVSIPLRLTSVIYSLSNVAEKPFGWESREYNKCRVKKDSITIWARVRTICILDCCLEEDSYNKINYRDWIQANVNIYDRMTEFAGISVTMVQNTKRSVNLVIYRYLKKIIFYFSESVAPRFVWFAG